MLSNFLQFALNLGLLSVVTVGLIASLPVVAGWLRSLDCLCLSPCKARLASYVVALTGVFLMGNFHVLTDWSHVLSIICFVCFGGYGLRVLYRGKVWEKFQWPDSCQEPPKPPADDCGCK
jgi:hypothetical protein